MADIFLSYNEKDRDTVGRLAGILQSAGWSVWWDRRIPAGSTWRSVLARELQDMRCMVVLWSSHSVQSEWVCEEADEGRLLGRLVPVLIERVRPPAGFREVQAADLIDWDGSRDFPGLQRLVEDIGQVIGTSGLQKPALQAEPLNEPTEAAGNAPVGGEARPSGTGVRSASDAPQPRHTWLPWAGAALMVFMAVAIYLVMTRQALVDKNKEIVPLPGAATPSAKAPIVAPPHEAPAIPAAVIVTKPKTPAEMEARHPIGTHRTDGLPLHTGDKPAPVANAIGRRCATLQERLSLGETLSGQSQLYFRQECQK